MTKNQNVAIFLSSYPSMTKGFEYVFHAQTFFTGKTGMLKVNHFFLNFHDRSCNYCTDYSRSNKRISQSVSMRPRYSPPIGWGVLRVHRDTHGSLEAEPKEVVDSVNSFKSR